MGFGIKTRLLSGMRDFIRDPMQTEPAMEPVFQRLVERDLARLGVTDEFYPVGGAASYGFLYLIIRIGSELRPHRVLDVGAGQSSLLWSRLSEIGLVQDVITLESDPEWAAHVRSKVKHSVIVSPLRPTLLDGRYVETYDWEEALAGGPFAAVTCDGPPGTHRFSRLGIMNVVQRLAADYVIVLDDSERPGERETLALLRSALPNAYRGVVNAAKRQDILAGGNYKTAAYFGAASATTPTID